MDYGRKKRERRRWGKEKGRGREGEARTRSCERIGDNLLFYLLCLTCSAESEGEISHAKSIVSEREAKKTTHRSQCCFRWPGLNHSKRRWRVTLEWWCRGTQETTTEIQIHTGNREGLLGVHTSEQRERHRQEVTLATFYRRQDISLTLSSITALRRMKSLVLHMDIFISWMAPWFVCLVTDGFYPYPFSLSVLRAFSASFLSPCYTLTPEEILRTITMMKVKNKVGKKKGSSPLLLKVHSHIPSIPSFPFSSFPSHSFILFLCASSARAGRRGIDDCISVSCPMCPLHMNPSMLRKDRHTTVPFSLSPSFMARHRYLCCSWARTRRRRICL